MRVAIFCIEVPDRDLSEEQYAIEAAAEVAYCFELKSLSGTEVQKMPPEESLELTTGEGFHFTFLIYWTSFSLNAGNPVYCTIYAFVYFLFWNS